MSPVTHAAPHARDAILICSSCLWDGYGPTHGQHGCTAHNFVRDCGPVRLLLSNISAATPVADFDAVVISVAAHFVRVEAGADQHVEHRSFRSC